MRAYQPITKTGNEIKISDSQSQSLFELSPVVEDEVVVVVVGDSGRGGQSEGVGP